MSGGWSSGGSSGASLFRRKSGLYYTSFPVHGLTSGAPGLNVLRVSPMVFDQSESIDRIGIEVTVLGVGAVIRLGIWSDSGDGYPGALLLDAGTVDASSIGFKENTVAQMLGAGIFWFGAVSQVASSSYGLLTSDVSIPAGRTAAALTGNNPAFYQHNSAVVGAFSGAWDATVLNAGAGPKILVRAT